MALHVRTFEEGDSDTWDAFVPDTTTGTFLHSRKFISYHGQRFSDRSLLLYTDKDALVGLFPAALDPANSSRVVSHPGITYGGLLHEGRLKGAMCQEALESICTTYRDMGIDSLRYKAVPYVYHSMPAQDDLHALFMLNATMYRRDLSCGVELRARADPAQRRRRALKKAHEAHLSVVEDFGHIRDFWNVLEQNLAARHDAKPVHGIQEILMLRERFPEDILLIAALQGRVVIAGTVLFHTRRVMHAQYIASNEEGRALGALDAVFERAITLADSNGCSYFDFGISTEREGRYLNQGLYDFKAEFGGAGVVYDHYEVSLTNIPPRIGRDQ